MNKIKPEKAHQFIVLLFVVTFMFLQTACLPIMKLREELKKSNSADSNSKKNYKPKYARTFDLADPTDVVAKEVYDLILEKDFDAIEKLANDARENKERLVGGYWKLDSIYEGLGDILSESAKQKVTNEMWEDRIEILKDWKNKSPHSITARVALALTYINYGWFARGSGYINAVDEADIKLLNERLSLAEHELVEAKNLDIRCPRWYREVLFLGMARGISQAEFNETYEEAINFEPNYQSVYLVKSEYLMPRWGGQEGDWERYIKSLPSDLEKLKTDEADIIFFIVLAAKLRDTSADINPIMNLRDHIYKGYSDLEKKYKTDRRRLNQCAYLSFNTGNTPGAKWAFEKIGDDWDRSVWSSRETFDIVRRAALQNEPSVQK